MRKQPCVVFVFGTEGGAASTRYGGFARRLKKAGALPDHKILTVALENLVFFLDGQGGAEVTDSVSHYSLGDAAFVYLKTWESMPEEAAAIATFLTHKGVPFADSLPTGMGVSKLVTNFRLWGHGVPVPPTLYVRRRDRLKAALDSLPGDTLGAKIIVKDVVGAKGKRNFLVDKPLATEAVQDYPDVHFLCQAYVPNQGDYRVGVYMGKPRFAIKRVGNGKSHLNNTSAGGSAHYVAVEDLPPKLLRMATKAAQACELQIAGVDLIEDSQTKRLYVLEVNQGSQIVTGAFSDENSKLFAEALNETVRSRYARTRKKPAQVIGRRTRVRLPELGVVEAVAKVDTGAYSSALHADNIREEEHDGVKELVFDVRPHPRLATRDGKVQTVRTRDYFIQQVRSSNGVIADRYTIRTPLVIGGMRIRIAITLSDRSLMGNPILLGRKVIRSRFLINVELDEENKPSRDF